MRDAMPILLLLAGCTILPPDDATPDASSAATASGASEEGGEGSTAGEGGSETSAGPSTSQGPGSGDSDPETSAGPESSSGSAEGSESGGTPTCGGAPGTIYVQRDYETEDPEELFVEPVASATYIEGDCFDGSNCWQINPNGENGNEDHAGWGAATLPRLAEGGTKSMFIGHMLYISSGMTELMLTTGLGGKMLDGYQHDLPDGGGDTRQTLIWTNWDNGDPDRVHVDTMARGLVPRLVKGGAGGNYVKQIGPTEFDLQDYADQWIWLEVEFNAEEQYTALWVKTQDGVFEGCEPIMQRRADDPADWVQTGWIEEPYVYVDEGWQTPGLAWGYWDNLENIPFDAEDFVRLDHMIVSDAFIDPPF